MYFSTRTDHGILLSTMETKNILALLVFLLLWMSGCASILITTPTPAPSPVPRQPESKSAITHEASGIPNGHLPPPGQCRIWYPDRPAGQQPAPEQCPIAANRVPVGAWVVSREEGNPKRIVVWVYHQQRPGVIVDTRYYTVGN